MVRKLQPAILYRSREQRENVNANAKKKRNAENRKQGSRAETRVWKPHLQILYENTFVHRPYTFSFCDTRYFSRLTWPFHFTFRPCLRKLIRSRICRAHGVCRRPDYGRRLSSVSYTAKRSSWRSRFAGGSGNEQILILQIHTHICIAYINVFISTNREYFFIGFFMIYDYGIARSVMLDGFGRRAERAQERGLHVYSVYIMFVAATNVRQSFTRLVGVRTNIINIRWVPRRSVYAI